MSAIYTDGDFTTVSASSAIVLEAPFEHTAARYVLRQKFTQTQSSRTVGVLNTQHASLTTYYLVSEGPDNDLGEGVCEWERTYAQKPDAFTEPGGTYTYNFIGIAGTFGPGIESATGRERFSRTVQSVVVNEFFIVGTAGGGLATPDYSTAQAIPLETVTRYHYELAEEIEADYLYDDPPATTPTVPSRTEYLDWCEDDKNDADSYTIVVSSEVTRWMGNIWVRQTRKIKAI